MVAIYVRKSVEIKDSLSIESQIDICKKCIVNNEEYIIYEDNGYSGGNINRPGYKSMMTKVYNNEISKIIVYKIDRFSRNLKDLVNTISVLEEYNVKFVSATESIDSSTPVGQATLNIMGTMAQLERQNIQKRVKDNYYYRIRQGGRGGGKPLFGYNTVKITINNKNIPILSSNSEAKIVQYMFNEYSSTDITVRKLALKLNNKFKTSMDGSRVSKLLKHPSYVKADIDIYNYYKSNIESDIKLFNGNNGLYKVNGKLYIGLHKGIIDSKTFLLVQAKLNKNKQTKRTGLGNTTWISNCYCSKCEGKLSINIGSSGLAYYHCNNKRLKNNCQGLETTRISDIEANITPNIINKLNILKEEKFSINNKNTNKINDIKIEICTIDNSIKELLNKIIDCNSTVVKYINNKIEELNNNKLILEKEILQLSLNKEDTLKELIDIVDFEKLDLKGKQRIFNILINNILIDNDSLTINWNI